MLVVGLTGGIGSGKSTVSALLAEKGAVVVDADVAARRVVEPGGAAYGALVERFGRGILADDGTIDRPALAALAFDDPQALADLNDITHPAVGQVIAEQLAAQAATDNVVILDVPLLAEVRGKGSGAIPTAGVIVVDCPEEVAVRRLVEQRALDEDDAWRRVRAQASRDERRALAGFVIDNGGRREDLTAQVDAAWAWVQSLREAASPA